MSALYHIVNHLELEVRHLWTEKVTHSYRILGCSYRARIAYKRPRLACLIPLNVTATE